MGLCKMRELRERSRGKDLIGNWFWLEMRKLIWVAGKPLAVGAEVGGGFGLLATSSLIRQHIPCFSHAELSFLVLSNKKD